MMKIRATNTKTGVVKTLEFESIEEAKKRNPYFNEFMELIDITNK